MSQQRRDLCNVKASLPWVAAGAVAGVGVAVVQAAAFYDATPPALAMVIPGAAGGLLGCLMATRFRDWRQRRATTQALDRLGRAESYGRVVAESFEAAKSSGVPFSVLQIDVDNYLSLTTDGPDRANRILHGVATVIADTLHADGFAAWLSADRFGVVAPGTGRLEARALAEQIRTAIERWDFAIDAPVTCSIGLSQWTFQDTLPSVIDRAERSLLAAKMMGKNSVSSGEIRMRPKGRRGTHQRVRVASVA